jgi:hypothetical protein
MSTPILATKLFVQPPRVKAVLRPSLIERLNEGLSASHKLTLISAPAGFGKTTLVSEWVAVCKRPVAWLSLDEGDNEPTCFLTYLVVALQTVAPKIGEGIFGILQGIQSQPPPTESILTTLLNEITKIPDNFVYLEVETCREARLKSRSIVLVNKKEIKMKTLQKFGGFSALYLAFAYVIGMVLFLVLLNYSSMTDPAQRVAMAGEKQMVFFSTNLLMYVFFGVFLIALSLALYDRLKSRAPAATLLGSFTHDFGKNSINTCLNIPIGLQ